MPDFAKTTAFVPSDKCDAGSAKGRMSPSEDVFGRFPVVQSVFEPGLEYFVTPLPNAANPNYPSWDQRYYLLPHDAFAQEAFGALSIPLSNATGLHL